MKAYSCDPTSIFGGIVSFNREVNEKTAEELSKILLEIIIAPSYTKGALEVLSRKKNLRVIACHQKPRSKKSCKSDGGLLVQEEDRINLENLEVVTKKLRPKKKKGFTIWNEGTSMSNPMPL